MYKRSSQQRHPIPTNRSPETTQTQFSSFQPYKRWPVLAGCQVTAIQARHARKDTLLTRCCYKHSLHEKRMQVVDALHVFIFCTEIDNNIMYDTATYLDCTWRRQRLCGLCSTCSVINHTQKPHTQQTKAELLSTTMLPSSVCKRRST